MCAKLSYFFYEPRGGGGWRSRPTLLQQYSRKRGESRDRDKPLGGNEGGIAKARRGSEICRVSAATVANSIEH